MKSRGLESMDTGQLRVLREKGLAEKFGVSRDTARKIRHGEWGPDLSPAAGDLGGCRGRWLSSEVDAWLESRPVSERK